MSSSGRDCPADGVDRALLVGRAHRTGHPDLVLSGQSSAVVHHVLNTVAVRVLGRRTLRPEWWRPLPLVGAFAVDPPTPLPAPPEALASVCRHVVEDGDAVTFVARNVDDERGEEWSVHCGGNHDDSATITLVHLAHVVRSTPSLRELSDLGYNEIAWRPNADSPWERAIR